jgi:hypothetical protein
MAGRELRYWAPGFAAPRAGEGLFLYSFGVPRRGVAVHHRHKGDYRLHAHLGRAPSAHHGYHHHRHADGEHQPTHYEHSHADERPAHERGHWHLLSPLSLAGLAHSILVVALQFGCAGAAPAFYETFDFPLTRSARSPPSSGLDG